MEEPPPFSLLSANIFTSKSEKLVLPNGMETYYWQIGPAKASGSGNLHMDRALEPKVLGQTPKSGKNKSNNLKNSPGILKAYILFQFLLLALAVSFFGSESYLMGFYEQMLGLMLVAWSCYNCYFLVRRSKHAYATEFFRHVVNTLFVASTLHQTPMFRPSLFIASSLAFLSLFILVLMVRLYHKRPPTV